MFKVPIKKYIKGAFIYISGTTPPKEFYIIKQGKVEIARTNPLLNKTNETRSTGYIFGIIQCNTGVIEDESAKALTDVEVFVISKEKIQDLFINNKKVIIKIISEYSEILRKLDSDLINYDLFPSSVNREERVFDVVRKYLSLKEEKKAEHLLSSILNEYKGNAKIKSKVMSIKPDHKESKLFEANDKSIYYTKVEAKTIIFTEYEKAHCFYVIKSGKVKITKIKKNKEMLLAILDEGDIFGEMAVLNDKPRNAAAIAEDTTEFMVIKKDSIENLPPPIFVRLLEVLSKRIWLVQQQIISFKLPSVTAKLYYMLTSILKQEVQLAENELGNPYVFKFPLKELCQMVDYEYSEMKKDEISDFMKDNNFDFYVNAIKVKNIKRLFDKNSYHFGRALMSFKV
jgi:CRP-like cAMP-binding protein